MFREICNDENNVSADILISAYFWNNLKTFCEFIMQMAKLKCGEIFSHAS